MLLVKNAKVYAPEYLGVKDILIMNEDLSLDTVIAMGVPMMRDGKILKKGTYEK